MLGINPQAEKSSKAACPRRAGCIQDSVSKIVWWQPCNRKTLNWHVQDVPGVNPEAGLLIYVSETNPKRHVQVCLVTLGVEESPKIACPMYVWLQSCGGHSQNDICNIWCAAPIAWAQQAERGAQEAHKQNNSEAERQSFDALLGGNKQTWQAHLT